jgi:hypothetical protein
MAPELSEAPGSGYGKLARQEARRRAREALGYADDELIGAVFVDPFGRAELTHPLFDRLQKEFTEYAQSTQTRRVLPDDWSMDTDNARIEERPFTGRRLLWDRAAGVRAEHTFESDDYGLLMAASDVAFTKGDSLIESELQFMGVPTIMSFLRSGEVRIWSADAENATPVESEHRSLSAYTSKVAPRPDDGVQNAAFRIDELLRAITVSPAPEISRMVNEVSNRELEVALFRKWFGKYRTWYEGRKDSLVTAISSVLDTHPPICYQGVLREAEEEVSRALSEAVQQWTESSRSDA